MQRMWKRGYDTMAWYMIGILLVIFVMAISIVYFFLKNLTLQKQLDSKSDRLSNLNKAKRSSEIRLGNIVEQFAPILPEWEYDPTGFKFLGKPIDGIQFNENDIVFIEIKSGKSSLAQRQKRIKELVKQGKVSFKTFRVNEHGSKYNK
jgi:predicted Holliday junction resolvase-like endonuclease